MTVACIRSSWLVVLVGLLLAGCQQTASVGTKPDSQAEVGTASSPSRLSSATENQGNEPLATRQVTIAVSGMV